MINWNSIYKFSQPKNGLIYTSSVSLSYDGSLLSAGTSTGQVLIFQRIDDDLSWENIAKFDANTEYIDARAQKEINPTVLSSDFFQNNVKPPLFITAGQKDIRIWNFYTKTQKIYETRPDSFLPTVKNGPRSFSASEVLHFMASEGKLFTSVKTSQDGITFGFTEGSGVVLSRLDRVNFRMNVFSHESDLNRIDFSPNSSEVIVVGTSNGLGLIVDLRESPKPGIAAMKAQYNSTDVTQCVYDCRFSPDGKTFYTRYPNEMVLWDTRNTSKPLKASNIFKVDCKLNGVPRWHSCWIDDKSVATGGLGGVLHIISSYDKEKKLKTKSKFIFYKKSDFDKDNAIITVDGCIDTSTIVVSSRRKLTVYDAK